VKFRGGISKRLVVQGGYFKTAGSSWGSCEVSKKKKNENMKITILAKKEKKQTKTTI
jgi:hypothetical protein